jgi:hypothetical protein
MTQKGRETYLSDYMDQAKKGLRNLHGKDRKAMDIFFSRVRSHAVYFIIDNLASNASDKELNALNVYAEGFLRPPYDVVVLAVDCINSAGRTTPVLIFVDSFPNDEEAFFYYSTCSEKNKWTIPTGHGRIIAWLGKPNTTYTIWKSARPKHGPASPQRKLCGSSAARTT